MADAGISASSSVLATLLATASGDQPSAGPSAAAKPTDPFAALLATAAADTSKLTATTKSDMARTPDPIAALLAGTAAVPATPAATPAPKIVPIVVSQTARAPVVRATDLPAIETAETPIVSTSEDSRDRDDKPEDNKPEDKGKDPLADAIASGATAVLALAPAIVAPPPPVAAPVTATALTPARTGGSAAPVAPARIGGSAAPAAPAKTDGSVAPAASTKTDSSATPAAPARIAPSPHGDQPAAPETGSQPATSFALPSKFPVQSQPATLPVAHPAQLEGDPPLTAQLQTRAPVQSDVPVQIQSQAPDASAVPLPVERFRPVSAQPDLGRERSSAVLPRPSSADPKGPGSVQPDARPPQPEAPANAATPARPALPTEAVKTVVAVLRQDDAAPPSDETVPTAPILVATKPQAQPAAQPTTPRQPGGQTPPAQLSPRHHTTEASLPRRPADARRRVDVATNDAGVSAATQRAPESRAANEPTGFPAAPAKADTVVQQTLTIARDSAWLDRLARDIASAGNGGDLQFKLDPEHLGSLTVAITQSADGASIRLTADNDATRHLLLDAQPKLLAEARAQGLKVSDAHVDLNQNQSQSQNQQGQNQSHAQTANQDLSRWAQGGSSQNGGAQNGQNRQSSPGHQPFVSNLGRKAAAESESSDDDSGALYA